jgi:uncharacterized repeat protein (TIGR02543 family)
LLRTTLTSARPALLALALLAAACHDASSDAACPAGTEGCSCDEGACAAGLACDLGRCVPLAVGPDAGPGDAAVADLSAPDQTATDAPEASCGETPLGSLCPCRDNADCASGFCVASRNGGSVCTTSCIDSCPDGWDCQYVTLPGIDPTFLCVATDLNLCRPCTDDDECQRDALGASGARCVRYDDGVGSFCGIPCGADADCPASYACREVPALETGSLARQCVLADPEATCECTGRAVEGSAWTACSVETCEGTRVCRADGLTACTDLNGNRCDAPVEVLVTFDAQGGVTPSPATRPYVFGRVYGPLPEATRPGYDAGGWWTEPLGRGARVEATSIVDRREPFTLYATWSARRFTVSFDSAGGSSCQPLQVTYAASYGASGPLCRPTRAHHTFSGWSLPADAGGTPVGDDTAVAIAADHTLRARWTGYSYTVSFDSEGGTACPPITVQHGATYGAGGALCEPTRPGYTFSGWSLGDGGTGDRVAADTVVTATGDHALHARWLPRSFTVTQDSEGGAPCEALPVVFGQPYGPLCEPTRPGYAFGGWWSADDGAGTPVTAATLVTTPRDHTLHARWTVATVTVTFDSEGGSACPARTLTFGQAYGASGALCEPTRAGYTFGGWWTGDNGTGDAVTAQTAVTRTIDHAVHARWTANAYSVTYDSEGGSACPQQGVTFGAIYGPLCEPTRAGYTFGGWWTGDNGTGNTVTADTVVVTASNHTLYARWTARSFTVTFLAPDGTPPSPAIRVVTFGAAYGALASTTRAGYTFLGWWTEAAVGGTQVGTQTLVSRAEDHALHARWEPAAYSISYDTAGGTSCGAKTVTFGAPYGALCATTRVGHTFLGWWTAADGQGTQVTADTVVSQSGSHTLYASWRQDTYTVTLDSAGGTACAPLSVVHGGTYGNGAALCTPTRAGYTFQSWRTEANGQGTLVTGASRVTATADHTLHASWQALVYHVTFDSEGGSGCSPLNVTFGNTYGSAATGGRLCAPTKPFYTFEGWWTGDDGTGSGVTADTRLTTPANHTLYARWALTITAGFRRIPAGSFLAGSPEGEPGRDGYEQQIAVTITRDFELSEVEVTQGQWKALASSGNPTSDPGCGLDCPVDRVSWWSALGFANALSVKNGYTPCYNLSSCVFAWNWGSGNLDCGAILQQVPTEAWIAQECTGYRLPTEAEWEYAARAGTQGATWLGDIVGDMSDCETPQPSLDPIAWWSCNADRLKPGKGKAPNPWGLYDMLGNVGEWTWDSFDGVRVEAGTDPVRFLTAGRFELSVVGAANRTKRVVRGGDSVSGLVRAARRDARAPTGWAGVRLARTLPTHERPRFVFLHRGDLTVGSPAGEVGRSSNELQAAVSLTRHFELTETEVTQGQWRSLSGGVNPSYFQTSSCVLDTCTSTQNQNDLAPVERVSWWSALAYANALSAASGLSACYALPQTKPDGSPCTGTWQAGTLDCGAQSPGVAGGDVQACGGYRLPTEAEWEFAARAGTTSATWLGELAGTYTNCMVTQAALDTTAWWCGNAGSRTRARRTRVANPWDLYDLHGNVWEWVWDAFDAVGPAGGVDPQRNTVNAALRVRRGGSWNDGSHFARAAARSGQSPSGGQDSFMGFRLARTSPNQETWVAVSFDSEGGSACGGISVRTDERYGARGPLCLPTRDGWVFEGWWTGDNGSGALVAAETLVGAELGQVRTLSARWRYIRPQTIAVQPGTFTAGSPVGEVGRYPDETQVSVTLTRPYELGETEVTQQQWRVLAGRTVGIHCDGGQCPANVLTWWSALGFLNAMSTASGLTPCYVFPATGCSGTWQAGTLDCGNDRMPQVTGGNVYDCEGYRLPTEVEFEYAARAGTTTATYAGDLNGTSCPVTLTGQGPYPANTPLDAIAANQCSVGLTAIEVRQKAPNPWGFYDILGNAFEWTWDRYNPAGAPGGVDPQYTASGSNRVWRGGSIWYGVDTIRAGHRATGFGANWSYYIGFRVARTLPPQP